MVGTIAQSLQGQTTVTMNRRDSSEELDGQSNQSQNCNFEISDEGEHESLHHQMTLDVKRMSIKPAEAVEFIDVRQEQAKGSNGVLELNDDDLYTRISRDFDEGEDIANVGTVK
jgi:hypothetical protein